MTITIPFAPVAKGRARTLKTGRSYTPKKTADATKQIRDYLVALMSEAGVSMFAGGVPLDVEMKFYLHKPKKPKHPVMPCGRPDCDNIAKLIMDAGNGILWADDCQIIRLTVTKMYADSGLPCTHMTVRKIPVIWNAQLGRNTI